MSGGIGGAPTDQEDPRADLIWGTVPRLVDDAALRHGSAEALVDFGMPIDLQGNYSDEVAECFAAESAKA